jgi:hypothetical protein
MGMAAADVLEEVENSKRVIGCLSFFVYRFTLTPPAGNKDLVNAAYFQAGL